MDFVATVLSQFGAAVPIEDADSVGVQGLELIAGEGVFAGVVSLVLCVLDAVVNQVPLQLVRLGEGAG